MHIDGLNPALDRIATALEAIANPPDRSNAAMATALKAAEQLAAVRLETLQAVKVLLLSGVDPRVGAVYQALALIETVLP